MRQGTNTIAMNGWIGEALVTRSSNFFFVEFCVWVRQKP